MKDQIIAPENGGRIEIESYDGILNLFLSAPADILELNWPSNPYRACQIMIHAEAHITNISHTGSDIEVKFNNMVSGSDISYVWCPIGRMFMCTGINGPKVKYQIQEPKTGIMQKIKQSMGMKNKNLAKL